VQVDCIRNAAVSADDESTPAPRLRDQEPQPGSNHYDSHVVLHVLARQRICIAKRRLSLEVAIPQDAGRSGGHPIPTHAVIILNSPKPLSVFLFHKQKSLVAPDASDLSFYGFHSQPHNHGTNTKPRLGYFRSRGSTHADRLYLS
jgi:hypothetical protein